MTRAASASALLALLVLARPAEARERPAFRELTQKGAALYKAGQYTEAVEALRAAYAVHPLPALLFNIGQAQRKRGEAARAVDCYESYLRVEPRLSGEARKEVETFMTEAREAADGVPTAGGCLREDLPAVQAPRPVPKEAPPPPPSRELLPIALPPPPPPPPPVYRRAWFWVVLGSAAAAAVTVGAVVGTQVGRQEPSPNHFELSF